MVSEETAISIEAKAVEIITNLEKLAEPAMQLALRAIQLTALIDTILSVVAVVALTFLWVRYGPRAVKWIHDTDSDMEIPAFVVLVLNALFSGGIYIAAAVVLLSASTWVAIFAPELALAKILLGKVVG